MGTIFRRTERRPIPRSANIVEKAGKRVARWHSRGRLRTAPVEVAADGTECVVVESGTYVAKYRDHAGKIVERSTKCREEATARQQLAAWEREEEQIRVGILEPGQLATARSAVGSLESHLGAYEQSLMARDVSGVYLANTLSAIRRVRDELGLNSLKDLRREKVEPWFAKAIAEEMGARNRNHFRDSLTRFSNWCRETGRIREHDLDKLPKADERQDPKRTRRALTEAELGHLFAVARLRPLEEARTIRRGKNKGKLSAEVRPVVVARLEELGRERALIYRTLLFTGLRSDELRTLAVSQLDFTPGAELIRLEAKNEKNGAGSTIPLRSDLAAELRDWIAENGLTSSSRLFTVPAGLCRILNRDMKAAGIPKRDERGRTVDVHALRTTLGTMLSTTGTAPRTAQAAMRHSDIKLTMGVYTDPKLLEVREALERLPAMQAPSHLNKGSPPTKTPPTRGKTGLKGAPSGNVRQSSKLVAGSERPVENPRNVNEKAPVTSSDITGAIVGLAGFEPTTSCTPSKRASQAALQPD